ncbi:MAG: hypothetical protein SFY67_11520 [Candidatus Melainabacteria bacterium]|nr:hypothetical protein [Candidatus Melainabacteria bacterium]
MGQDKGKYMFPTPPELREELHEVGQSLSLPSVNFESGHQSSANEECLCGCAERPDNSKKILKIKIFASMLLVLSISLVGLNAYQRDAAQASNNNKPRPEIFENPAGAIQAAETVFPTMVPLNETQSFEQSAMPVQMTPQMATPMRVPVQNYQNYPAHQQYPQYTAQYNPYPANYTYQMPHCTNEVRQDLVGQRLKRFVSR